MTSLTTLTTFHGTDGESPSGTIVVDQQGDLFGIVAGGINDSVYELPFTDGSYAATPITIANFTAATNSLHLSFDLAIDGQGDLFGTIEEGGESALGSVFEIAKTDSGYATTPATIATFNDTQGEFPTNALIADGAGNLFGVAAGGGANSSGTVFEIAKTAGVYASTPVDLADMNSATGANPSGPLTMDANGDIFGTTHVGGPVIAGGGSIFELIKSDGTYETTPTVLAGLDPLKLENSVDDGHWEGLAMDAAGDLFGEAQAGVSNPGVDAIYELVKSAGTYSATPTILTTFSANLVGSPGNGLVVDAAGNIFGTSANGGDNGTGSIFELVKSNGTYESTLTPVLSFDGMNGSSPDATLLSDGKGGLFGTTTGGGPTTPSDGTVFQLTGTGFQPPCYVEGTGIATPIGPCAIERLAPGDLVLTHMGKLRQIKWMGNRHVDCHTHPTPTEAWPVRIRAHAFGAGMPYRDLWLSPDHSVFLNDALIPIRYLINGTTIVQEQRDEVVYWHIELDGHDVILAEGLPAETYLDTGNRSAFSNVVGSAIGAIRSGASFLNDGAVGGD